MMASITTLTITDQAGNRKMKTIQIKRGTLLHKYFVYIFGIYEENFPQTTCGIFWFLLISPLILSVTFVGKTYTFIGKSIEKRRIEKRNKMASELAGKIATDRQFLMAAYSFLYSNHSPFTKRAGFFSDNFVYFGNVYDYLTINQAMENFRDRSENREFTLREIIAHCELKIEDITAFEDSVWNAQIDNIAKPGKFDTGFETFEKLWEDFHSRTCRKLEWKD